MRNKPKQPTGIIVAGIGAILILAAIAVLIIYLITKEPDTGPDPEAARCCTCDWTLEISGNEETTITSATGLVSKGQCTFPTIEPSLGNHTPSSCTSVSVADVFSNIPDAVDENAQIIAVEGRERCEGGCIFHTSDPLLPPSTITDENNNVTFTTYFELRYALDPEDEYSEARMVITYPNDANSPDPIGSSTFELVSSNNEGTGKNSLLVKTYKAIFDTTWETVLNPDTNGIYSVAFQAKDPQNKWTNIGQCKRTFELTSEIHEGNYCYSLDAAPVDGRSPLDVTLSVDAGVPKEDPTSVYQWELDLNCNGEIDEGEGEAAETFTTPTTTNSITRTFSITGSDISAKCSTHVSVLTKGGTEKLDDLSPGSCSAKISLARPSETEGCGNGICDGEETCDPDGNISCPSETPLGTGSTCRSSCTYCGDGTLDESEDCDIGASQGQTGYNPYCRNNCTAPEIPPNCGNGVFDENEQCDPAVPEGQPGYNIGCQIDCTISSTTGYCGNGVLDSGEECDPAIQEGHTGYSPNCQSSCLVGSSETGIGVLAITQKVPVCVELVSPKNVIPVIVTISNNTTSAFEINAISDTLPQGFAYSSGSSSVNSAVNTADTGVILEMSGSSQLITWTNGGAGWSVAARQSLVLSFSAIAGGSATMGSQVNTVTVTPSDGDPIPGTSAILVAQVCTQPSTGVFNRNVVIILAGLLVLLMSGAAYYSGFGTSEVASLIQKGVTNSRSLYLRLSKPQKYAEKKIEQSALKNFKQRTNGTSRSQ